MLEENWDSMMPPLVQVAFIEEVGFVGRQNCFAWNIIVVVGNPDTGQAPFAYCVWEITEGPLGGVYVPPETHIADSEVPPLVGVQLLLVTGAGTPVIVGTPEQSALVK